MKAVLLLLSVWLLVLTGLPCPDADCHAHEPITASPSQTDEHDHGHKAPCSPFCHCATCLGFSVPQSPGSILPEQPADPSQTQQVFAYQSPSLIDIALVIWHPPKV